uniref:Si:dkey-237j11.3 n=1 Tax=Paramormyrops kingsleyae TaxID=1676925 RepID=A0A3B3T0T0_9TELE
MKLVLLQTLCFAIGLVTIEPNPEPCTSANGNNAYDEFLSKHVCNDTLVNINLNEWQMLFNEHKALCDSNRTTQSFLQYNDKSHINGVCKRNGLNIHMDNLCISNHAFSFITVKMDNNCNIQNVTNVTKYIILGCDKFTFMEAKIIYGKI